LSVYNYLRAGNGYIFGLHGAFPCCVNHVPTFGHCRWIVNVIILHCPKITLAM
jgi:hypothetical protein